MNSELMNIVEQAKLEQHLDKKITLYEKALQLAELNQDDYSIFKIKLVLCNVRELNGEYNEIFKPFLWCINFFDTDQHYIKENDDILLFFKTYKLFLEYLVQFPLFNVGQIEFFFEFFKSNCEKYDYSLRTYYKLKYKHFLINGYNDYEEYFMLWQETEMDSLSDPIAYEVQDTMYHLLYQEDTLNAFQLSDCLLYGELSTHSLPLNTRSNLILPLFLSGQFEKAKQMQEQSQFQLNSNTRCLKEISEHILYLSLTEPKKAIPLVMKYIDYANQGKHPYGQFYFYLASWILGEKCNNLNLSVPYSISYVEEATVYIANTFDKRNMNNFFHYEIQQKFSIISM